MKLRNPILLFFPITALAAESAAPPPTSFWFREPAQVWTEALPVGNGRLGAMVFGGLAEERLQLNEDTIWSGMPHEYHRPEAVKVLPELRRLLWAGQQKEAEELAMREFMSVPLRQEMYQPLGDIRLSFPGHDAATAYRRELDLDAALVTVSYRVGDVAYTRETLSSHPDQVLAQRVSADRPGAVTFTVRLTSPHEGAVVAAVGAAELQLAGRVRTDGLPFAARLRVVAEGGRVTTGDGVVTVEGANAATLLLTAASAHVNFRDISGDPMARSAAAMAGASRKDYGALKAAHQADHRSLFRRMTIDLGASEAASWPIDRRLSVADKSGDPHLVALLAQYGRYLLIASSRPGAQAANLQGIWNEHLMPSWGSKYTMNINFEMNYWPAEVANLAECAEPMFAMIDDLVISGRKTARGHYGAPGWVLHHNTDLWRGTAPINNSNHGIWPTGGAWLCLHLWERYLFSRDRDFLEQRAYPIMREAAQFFVATLVEDPGSGLLISGPSNSPEHGGLVMGPTMDHQIVRGLFTWTAGAARILGRDAEFAAQLDTLRGRIAPNRIGRHGQLQEWLEDRDDPNNKHRHVSHLWGVFPGQDITWGTPDLMRAARQSLLHRGDDGTGWSLGWKIALWARFLDGDHAHKIIQRQLTLVRDQPGRNATGGGGTYPNLFDAHPPFQIDGNFAVTAGVCEMLVQSHLPPSGSEDGFEIVLLPALPSAWPTGSISGLRARGGVELDLAWREGQVERLELRGRPGQVVPLRHGDRTVTVTLAANGRAVVGAGLRTR